MSFLSRAWQGSGDSEKRTVDFSATARIPSYLEDSASRDLYGGNSGGAMALPAFFSCVRILCDAVADLPIRAYKVTGEVTVPVNPQPLLLQTSPYPGMTMWSWVWMIMRSLAITGNAFGLITARDKFGKPTAIMPVHPDAVVVQLPNGNLWEWDQPVYTMYGMEVDSADVMHIKRYPIPGCVVGASPVQELASMVGLSLAAERYGLNWFRDAANPSGILSSDQELTPLQAKQAQQAWYTSHHGRRLPAVLGNNLKFQAISITPEESQFLETRAHQRSDIAMIFGIPPHMIGETEKQTSHGTGVEQQSIGFVVNTLRAWLECIEQALSMFLPRGQKVEFDIDDLLRGDTVARWEAYAAAIQNGVLSINEVRVNENRPPIEGGDIHLQPSNFVPLGYIPPEDPAPDPPADGEKGK